MSGLDSFLPILVWRFDFSSKFSFWSAKVWSLSLLWFPVSVKRQVWSNDYKRFRVLLLLLLDESNSHVDVPLWMRTNNSFQIFSAKKRCTSSNDLFQPFWGHRLESQRANSAGEKWLWLWLFIILRQFSQKLTTKTSACIMSLWISTTSAKRAIHKPSQFAGSKYG